jgi:hypothetical protein
MLCDLFVFVNNKFLIMEDDGRVACSDTQQMLGCKSIDLQVLRLASY